MYFNAVIGGPRWQFELKNQKFHSINPNSVKEWYFPEYVPAKTNHHKRDKIGLSEDDFVLISIGNNLTTFTKNFIDEMCNTVDRNKFVWLLVGQGAPDYLKSHYSRLLENRSVIECGYETDLYSLCSICNVLVRPNMSGGSGATAIAAMAGLPVAMTNSLCDASRWLGVDFLEEISDYSDLVQYVEKLSKDTKFYDLEKRKCLELVNNALSTPDKWIKLTKILKEGDVYGETKKFKNKYDS